MAWGEATKELFTLHLKKLRDIRQDLVAEHSKLVDAMLQKVMNLLVNLQESCLTVKCTLFNDVVISIV